MLKKVLIGSITICSVLFGYVSNLIKNDNIIDIGIKNPSKTQNIKISKIKVETNPTLTEIPNVVLDKERNITDMATCLIDKLGHENCPNNLVQCQTQQEKTNGYSTVHNRHIESPSIHISPENPDEIIRHYNTIPYVSYNSNKTKNTNPSGAFNEGAYTYHEQNGKKRIFYLKFNKIDERTMLCINNKEIYYSSKNGNLANGSKNCGHIYSTADIWGYSGTYEFNVNNGDTIYWAALNFHGPSGGSVYIYSCPANKPLNWSTMKCEPKGGEYRCPTGFKLSADKSYCYNDYKYYTYSCPTNSNEYGQTWKGPVKNTGGDCLGNCGSYGCSCNNATPPDGNCVRDNFTCPVDSSKKCSLLPSNNPTAGNSSFDENYIYNLGYSQKHTKTIETNMTCPVGWTLNFEKGTCEKEPNYKCSLNGFYYDKELGACIQNSNCESGVKDPNTGKCLYKPNYNCPDDGYIYNSGLKKCKKTPYCDRGTFNPVTNKCEEEASGNVCPNGYTYNKNRNRCEKPMNDYIEFTEHQGSLWVGKIGNNYLSGNCKIDNFDTSFKVTNTNLVEDFTLDYAEFDDYIGVILNNNYIYVGPYGGNTLYVDGGKTVYYDDGTTKKTGNCELDTSWEKSPNIEAKDKLIKGTNNVRIKIEVTGGGEGYARFHFKFKGRNTIQCIDNNYCFITFSNTCPDKYSYDPSTDICYIDNPNANEDLVNKVYWVSPNCPANGNLNTQNDTCAYEPTCSGNNESIVFNANNHVCVESPNITCNQNQSLITTNVPGYDYACINNDSCPSGSTLVDYGTASYCTSISTPICPSGSTYNKKTAECEENAICPTGYKIKDGKCIKEYSYYTYQCNEGWEGPVDSGNDCKGNCGLWGCSCNSSTPPANNCRKKSNATYSSKVIEKRPLIKHTVEGSLTPEEFGQKKDYECGKDCQYVVTKIQGQNNKLCFIKKNGQIGCFTVDGCRFQGTIDTNGEPIKELQIGEFNSTKNYSYYISLPKINKIRVAPDSQIMCYANNMKFNTQTRLCEGTSNLIKFTDGDWITAGADANWIIKDYSVEQTVNTDSPALLVSPFELGEGGIFKGEIKVTDTNDNDWIGLIFGYKDINNYYYVGWTKSSDSWHNYAGFIFGQKKDGKNIILSTDAENAGGWSPNTEYTLKIKYGPKYMKLYKNGTLVLDYKNDNFKPEKGKVGFYNYSQKDVIFSNFEADSYPKCPNGYTYNRDSGQCVQGYIIAPQSIESTCKMYGHVGGIYVKNGIVSAVVDKDAKINPLDDLFHKYNVTDYNNSYYDPSQRIDFWDSYNDHYLGFIEFLKEVKPKDSKDGFRVKNPRVFDIASYGFTAYSPLGTRTYYVSANPIGFGDMTNEKCQEVADKFGLTRITEDNIGYPFSEISKFLTGGEIEGSTENPVCLYGTYDEETKDCINIPEGKPDVKYCLHGKLSGDGTMCIVTPRCVLEEKKFRDINHDNYAYKVIYSNSNKSFQCSPWTCKNHQCAKAVCPEGYLGNLHNSYENIASNECQGRVCDAMLPYYEYCGKEGSCPPGPGYKQIDNKCYKLTCPNGTSFDPTTQKCVSFTCPPNTTLSSDGKYCIQSQ